MFGALLALYFVNLEFHCNAYIVQMSRISMNAWTLFPHAC